MHRGKFSLAKLSNIHLYSNSVEETEKIAAELARTMIGEADKFCSAKSLVQACRSSPNTIALKGDLGAGKTMFVRGFCAELGVNPNEVNSPTFTIVNEYSNSIYHIDAYRLENADPEDIGIWDYINNGFVTLIEWPQYIDIDYDITITIIGSGDEPREITYDYTRDR